MSLTGTGSSSKSLPSYGLDEDKPEVCDEKAELNAKSFLMQCGDTNDSL